MTTYDLDPDVVRWGLHHLNVCFVSSASPCSSVTQYETDASVFGYVTEGYSDMVYTHVENDAVIAQALQEELSRVAAAEASGSANPVQASIIAQDWLDPLGRNHSDGHEDGLKGADNPGKTEKDPGARYKKERDDFGTKQNEEGENQNANTYEGTEMSSKGGKLQTGEDLLHSLDVTDDSALDGEVGKRLNQMIPVPHVPKINGEIPSVDEEISDHQRLLERLQLYDLVENKVQGDGNCQFRSLSDQLYRSTEHHKFVREQVVSQLKSHPEMYEGYVPMAYGDYLKKMSKSGEWGDHVTLQAAADTYGVKIFVITSFKDTCYIEILPHIEKSERVICLSFWAEVHYNSIYPAGELPVLESKKKKKWWSLGN